MIFFTAAAILKGRTDLALLPACLVGGLIAYLFFNWHPAKVFMGDTGSLFLGGVVCGLAFALDMPLVLIMVGFVYIMETLSVILQVGYFKLTHGKRLFKMAPIHHHFEMCGWKEERIVLTFAGVSAVMCIIAWFSISGLIG
jgi:phospho-N-acetylmuramoyl-pentapeptide-transferase